MKSNFKNAILGLILALCCIFTICTSGFMGAKINATEGEIQEEEKEGKTYTYIEEGEGECSVTLFEDGTCTIIVSFIENQETAETQATYQIVDNYLILLINDAEVIFTINEETMTLIPDKINEPENPNEEQNPPIEENPKEEEPGEDVPKEETEKPLIGFFEENLETIIASALGVLGSIAAFFAIVLKTKKTIDDTLVAFKGNKISANEAVEKINTSVEELNKAKQETKNQLNQAKEEMVQLTKQIKEQLAQTKEFSEKILNEYSKELESIKNSFKQISDSLVLMANNNDDLVKKGVAEEINKKLINNESGENNNEGKEKAL